MTLRQKMSSSIRRESKTKEKEFVMSKSNRKPGEEKNKIRKRNQPKELSRKNGLFQLLKNICKKKHQKRFKENQAKKDKSKQVISKQKLNRLARSHLKVNKQAESANQRLLIKNYPSVLNY